MRRQGSHLIATGESIPLLSLEGVPGLPGAHNTKGHCHPRASSAKTRVPSNKVQTLAFPHSRKAFLASTPLHMLFSYQHEPPLSVFPAGYSYPSRSNSKNDFPKENFRNHNPQLHCHPVDIFSFTLDASGSVVKNPSAMQETPVRFLGWEDPLVKVQHVGALTPPCIVRKDPRVPHTARRGPARNL